MRVISNKKSWHINESTLVSVYKSLIRSLFDYSAYMSLIINDETLFNALESIQCSALRIIYGYKWDDKITNIKPRKKPM